MKSTVQEILNEELSSKQYDAEETTKWSKEISDLIKEKLKGMQILMSIFSLNRRKSMKFHLQNHY